MIPKKDIHILYEDEYVLALYKPAGIMVHGDGKSDEYTIADWVSEKYPEIVDVGEPLELSDGRKILKPGIVHRLDKDTSGVLLVAKKQEGYLFLKRQFQKRKILKVYHAIIWGRIKNDRGIIDLSIGRSKKDFRKRSADRAARGSLREAVTEYRVIKKNPQYSFLELYPKTGRTHQIRVHLQAIKHPIVCDTLYAGKRGCAGGLNRVALHASRIRFETPLKGQIQVEAPLPSDMQDALAKLELM